MRLFFIILLVGLFSISAIGQDSTKTQDRDNFQKKEQKQERANRDVDRFIDEDGDGINDAAMLRFQKMLRQGESHKDGNIEGSGEMERNQIRTRTGDPIGPGPQSGDQQKNKDTKKKNEEK